MGETTDIVKEIGYDSELLKDDVRGDVFNFPKNSGIVLPNTGQMTIEWHIKNGEIKGAYVTVRERIHFL